MGYSCFTRTGFLQIRRLLQVLKFFLAETRQNMEDNSKVQQKVFDEKIESLEFDKVQMERSFESERISFHNEIESLKKENNQLKNSIESLQRHLDAEMTEKAKFQKLFDTKSENFDDLMNNFTKTENQLQNQIKVYNEIIKENDILRANLQKVEEKNAILNNDFESLKMLKETLESEKNEIRKYFCLKQWRFYVLFWSLQPILQMFNCFKI